MHLSNSPAMQKRIVLLVTCFFAFMVTLHAQCVSNRDSVWNKVLEIADNYKRSPAENRIELKQLLAGVNNCRYKNDSAHALLLQIIGESYFKESDFLNAAAWYRQSIDLILSHPGPAMNQKKLINSYFWLSNIYDSLNNYPEKMAAIDKSINIALQLKYTSDFACIRALYERVKYRFNTGDYYSCINDATMCERLANNYATTFPYEIWTKKSIASSSLGWEVKSLLQLKNYAAAEALLLNKPEEYKKNGLDNYLGVVYEQMAEVQLFKKDYPKAISYFERALDAQKKSGYTLNCKQTINNLGNEVYFQAFRDNLKALSCYKKALGYINNDNRLAKEDLFETLNIYNNMANVYVQENRFDSAFAFIQRAFDQLKSGLNETGVLHSAPEVMSEYKKIHYLASLVIDKGDAYYKKFLLQGQPADIQYALNIYKTADQLLDRIKSAQVEFESKLFWRSDSRRLYEHAIAASYASKDPVTAFYFFEKSRAVLLNEQLDIQHRMNADDVSKLAQVKKKIAQLQRLPGNDTALFAAREELENLFASIRKDNPLFYLGLDTTYISLQDIRKKILQPGQSLMEIFAGDSSIYTLLVTPQQTFFNRINKSSFNETVSAYIDYISNRDLLNRDFAGFRKVSNQLYSLLFGQGAPPGNGRIVISPEGRYFPFESLVADNSQQSPVYFITDHAVSYTYSARYLANRFTGVDNPASHNLLGIAPVQYAASIQLPALSGSDQSLEKIASYIPGTNNITWKSASKNYFLQQFTGYRMIQLYTHAADNSDRNEPVIFFADARLYLSDLMTEHKPVTQLMVLSACQTANGTVYQGEGVFSFGRGFAALGIPSSVSNLWSVDNVSTYHVTEYFYKYLAKGLPIDVALQKAKLEFLNTASGENKLPYYWAPAILVGKTDPIAYKKQFPWLYILASVLVVALAGVWYVRRRSRKGIP